MPDKIVNHFVLADGSVAKLSGSAVIGDTQGTLDVKQLLTGVADMQNYFNPKTAKIGGYYSSTGTITANANGFYSEDYIHVSDGEIIHLSFFPRPGNIQTCLCTYTSNKVFIERNVQTSSNEITYTVPNGVYFIRVSVYTSLSVDLNTFVVSKETINKYLPFEYVLKEQTVDINNLKETAKSIDVIYSEVPLSHAKVTSQAGYYDPYGTFVENTGYKSIYYQVERDCDCYFNSNASYYSICVFSALPLQSSTCIQLRLRHNGGEDTTPKINSKLSLTAGTYVALTFLSNDTQTGFYTNDVTFRVNLKSNVYFGDTQIEQVTALMKSCYVVPWGLTVNQGQGLYIYIPSGNGFLKYDLKHSYAQAINCDVWRIDSLHASDNNLTDRFLATTEGEWECAVRLAGRTDFSGGKAHGDEVYTNIVFLVDGTPYDGASIMTMGKKQFTTLKVIETSTLYDPNDSVTEIAEHYKEYTFTVDGMHLLQHLDWKVNDSLAYCYLAMLTPSKLYTDMFYTDIELEPVASQSAYGDHPNVKKACQYSNDKGFYCSLEIVKYPTGLQGGDIFNLRDNDGGAYNKMYFNVCSGGTITAGTRWTAETVYNFSVGEPLSTN